MFRYVLSFLSLICSVGFCQEYCPEELYGKPFTFCHDKKIDELKLDCFFYYEPGKSFSDLTKSSNKYAKSKKQSNPKQIFGKRFVGGRIITFSNGRTIFTLADENGDSLCIVFPKFDKTKQFKKIPKSFADACLVSKHIRFDTQCGLFGRDVYDTYINLEVLLLDKWEKNLTTVLSNPQYEYSDIVISPPSYELLYSTYDYSGFPNVVLLKNNSDTIKCSYLGDNTSVASLEQIATRIDSMQKLDVELRDFITQFDSCLIDSLKSFIGKEILFASNLLSDELPASFIHHDFNHDKELFYEPYNGADWLEKETLSSAALGGPTYTFVKAYLSDVVLKLNVQNSYFNWKKKHYHGRYVPQDSVKFRYYLVLTHNPDSLYKQGNYANSPYVKGCELQDTILVPVRNDIFSHILSDAQFKSIKDGFYEHERKEWQAYNEEMKAYYEIAKRVWGEDVAKIVCKGEVRLGFNSEMVDFAFMRIPYRVSYNVSTPLGYAECRDFYTEDIKLYLIDDILVGIEWKGESLFQPRNRF